MTTDVKDPDEFVPPFAMPETPEWIRAMKQEEDFAMEENRRELGINNPEDIFDKDEPTQDDDTKEPIVAPNTLVMSAESLFGAASQKVLEEPVIKGVNNTGVNLMVLDTTPIPPMKIKPGAEIWLHFAHAVQYGTPLFGKYPAHKGNTTISVDTVRWQGKFKNLPVCEVPKGIKLLSAPLTRGGKSPAAFISEHAKNDPSLKLLLIDNLADFLPTWSIKRTLENLKSDLIALNEPCVEHRIAFMAILDIADDSQKNLWESYKAIQVETCLPVIRVKGEYVNIVTPEVKVSGKGFNSHLEFVDGKWTEIAENEKSSPVLDYTNQGKVLAAVKNMQGEFTAANVTVPGLTLTQVSSALNSLASKKMLERTRPKHFQMNSNK